MKHRLCPISPLDRLEQMDLDGTPFSCPPTFPSPGAWTTVVRGQEGTHNPKLTGPGEDRACPSDHVHDQVVKGMPPQLHWVAPASYLQTLVISAQEPPVFGADAGHIEHTQTPDVHLHWWLGYTHDSPSSGHGCPYRVGPQAYDPVSPEAASIPVLLATPPEPVMPPVAVVPPVDFVPPVPPVPPPVTPPLLTTPPLPTVLPPARTAPSVRALLEPPHPASAAKKRTQRMLRAAVPGIERVMAASGSSGQVIST